jgi:O-antigen ligase
MRKSLKGRSLLDKDILIEKLSRLIIYSIYIFALGIFTSKFLIYLGMGFSLVFWILKLIIKNREYKFKENNFILPVILFSLTIIISGIGNWHGEILDNKYFYSFIFFFIIVNELNRKKDIKIIIYLLFLSAIVSNFYGLYQYFYLNIDRVTGFNSALAFGLFQAIFTAIIILYLFFYKFKTKSNFILLILVLVSFANLILSQTRGAWLSFIGAIIFLGFMKSKKILIFIMISAIILTLFMPATYVNRFKSSFDLEYNLQNNRSNSVRMGLWLTALKMFKDNPINGIGLDNFRNAYINNYTIEGIRPFDHAHNNLLNFLAELGAFGFLAFIFLMWNVVIELCKYYKKEENKKIKFFYLSSIIIFIIYHLHGLTEYNFGDTEPLHFFWFLIALNVVIYNNLTGVELNEK